MAAGPTRSPTGSNRSSKRAGWRRVSATYSCTTSGCCQLILCENADPTVRHDLERYFARLVPDGAPEFRHTDEGPDDMPAHIRAILTQNSLSLPIADGTCDLGTWQGVYVWEHRTAPHRRRITVTALG